MTKRSANHSLETKSVRAFEAALPDHWESTAPDYDYGIDRRVEIFERSHEGLSRVTGLTFSVQLKATQKMNERALTVGVSWDTYDYWRSLAEPVLLVRYVAETDSLYAMWAHERGRAPTDDQLKRAWFRFEAADVMGPRRFQRLQADVEAFRLTRARRITFPLRLAVDFGEPGPSEVNDWNAEIQVRVGIGEIQLVAPDDAPLKASIAETLSVDFGDGLNVVLHKGHGVGEPFTAADLLVALGLCLTRVDNYRDAVACFDGAESPRCLWIPWVVVVVAGAYCKVADWDGAVSLIEACPTASIAEVAALRVGHDPELPAEFRDRLVDLQSSIVSAITDSTERARATYNLAGLHRAYGWHDTAVELFEDASALDPAYRERPSFWLNKAGSEFLCAKFLESAESYRRASSLEPADPRIRANFADSLLNAGRYQRVIQQVESVPQPVFDEVMTYHVAAVIVDRFGIPEQDRCPVSDDSPRLGLAGGDLAALELARLDALDPRVWSDFNPAAVTEHPVLWTVVAARLVDIDVGLWITAAQLADFHGLPNQTLGAIAARAKSKCGEEFLSAVLQYDKLLRGFGEGEDGVPESGRLLTIALDASSWDEACAPVETQDQ